VDGAVDGAVAGAEAGAGVGDCEEVEAVCALFCNAQAARHRKSTDAGMKTSRTVPLEGVTGSRIPNL